MLVTQGSLAAAPQLGRSAGLAGEPGLVGQEIGIPNSAEPAVVAAAAGDGRVQGEHERLGSEQRPSRHLLTALPGRLVRIRTASKYHGTQGKRYRHWDIR